MADDTPDTGMPMATEHQACCGTGGGAGIAATSSRRLSTRTASYTTPWPHAGASPPHCGQRRGRGGRRPSSTSAVGMRHHSSGVAPTSLQADSESTATRTSARPSRNAAPTRTTSVSPHAWSPPAPPRAATDVLQQAESADASDGDTVTYGLVRADVVHSCRLLVLRVLALVGLGPHE
ncbi:hypothetical protein U9M48_032058 [Paspalum notatum var. saurae]|uniref:Uncharacterized protein n=1 Tax=Paspalum notatum var. saurae TaxID=547442 RepID=A0AAQ3U4P1_PASNO